MQQSPNRLTPLLFLLFWCFSCSGDAGEAGSSSVEEFAETAPSFTYKMMLPVEGSFPPESLAYDCTECTIDQWLSIEDPEGWQKGPLQVVLAGSSELRGNPAPPGGRAEAYDFLDEVPGDEYQLIARSRVQLPPAYIDQPELVMLRADVERNTLLRFDAGRRVHELTDPTGQVYVLFAYQIDVEDRVIPEFQDADVLGNFFPNPDTVAASGWSLESRILEEPLLLDTPKVANVLVVIRSGGEHQSTWQKRPLEDQGPALGPLAGEE